MFKFLESLSSQELNLFVCDPWLALREGLGTVTLKSIDLSNKFENVQIS